MCGHVGVCGHGSACRHRVICGHGYSVHRVQFSV